MREGTDAAGAAVTAPLDPEELRLVVQRLSRRIRANRAGELIADAQLSVLFLLEKSEREQGVPELSPGRIAEHERVTPPSINRTLGGLEEAGWIVRRQDPGDARRALIRLSDTGRALIGETRRLRAEWLTQRLEELADTELARLAEALPVLRKLAEQ